MITKAAASAVAVAAAAETAAVLADASESVAVTVVVVALIEALTAGVTAVSEVAGATEAAETFAAVVETRLPVYFSLQILPVVQLPHMQT